MKDKTRINLAHPHGKGCGCLLTKEYSSALGCPNPTSALQIYSDGRTLNSEYGYGVKVPVEFGPIIKQNKILIN